MTPQQREQKNLRDRQRRLEAKQGQSGASSGASAPSAPRTVFEGTLQQQQTQRDQPFQQALGNSMKAQDKARALRVSQSQQRQAEMKDRNNS